MKKCFFWFCASFFAVVSQAQTYDSFRPGEIWTDIEGVPINAHGGGILYADSLYYWFGEHKIAGPLGNTAQVGISCYSSEDLYNWKNEGIALAVSDDPASEIAKGAIMERPKVIYNAKTRKYVMWFHLELKDRGYEAARTAVAVSDRVTGPYVYLRSYRPNARKYPENFQKSWKKERSETDSLIGWSPEWHKAVEEGMMVRRDFKNGQMSRDMTLFVDDDGKAYHIHASEDNLTLHISELTSDYTGFTGKYVRLFPAGHNEAPAICKYRGKYYMITSGCTGWAPNQARSFSADRIFGPWTALGDPCEGDAKRTTFDSQSTFLLPVAGKPDMFIFMADRWRPKNPIDGRYVWLPVSFEGDRIVLRWRDEWRY